MKAKTIRECLETQAEVNDKVAIGMKNLVECLTELTKRVDELEKKEHKPEVKKENRITGHRTIESPIKKVFVRIVRW